MAPARLDGGVEDGGQRLGRVVRVVPVAGQAGHPLVGRHEGGVGLQCLGVAAVEAGAFAGQQVVADGLADQGVAEAVAVAVGRGAEDAGVDGGAQGLDEVVLGEPGDGGQQPVLDGGAALGGDPGDVLGALRQCLDPDQEQVAQRVGEAGAAAVVGGDGEFLDEEGVAVGALEDLVDAVGFGFPGEDARDLPADLVAVEAAELDAPDRAQPVEFGEQRAQGVAAVDVVGAVGGEDDEAAGAQGAEEVGEQVAGGGVGPVQVLQGEDDGVLGGDALQQARGEFEEAGHALFVPAGLAGGGGAELGQQVGEFLLLPGGGCGELGGQVAAQPAQGGGEGGEGQPVGADLDAAAERDDRAPAVGRRGELLEEAGLADAGLTADQQRLRFAGAVGRPGERVVQRVELSGAADEHGTDGLGLHGPEHRTGPRGGRSGFPLLAHRHGAPSFSSRTPPWAVRTGDGAAAASVRPPPLGGAHAVRANQDRRRVWLSGSAPRAAVPRRAARRTRTASRTRRSVSARRISSSWRSRCSSISNMMVSPSDPVSVSLSAMPSPSSPRRSSRIGRVPYLRGR
ncbi:hypothetical protein GCM10019016_004550 [Streptomyces prasinosporus]|uniref:Uncharacterized protein n=1 Tax=Streptomyces prasinosporus TaxID=68256 RepID=A0ABP6TDQ6_9ACTN